jgi:hypothetical protein
MLSVLARQSPKVARSGAVHQQLRHICYVKGAPVFGEWVFNKFIQYESPVITATNQNYQFNTNKEMHSFLKIHDHYIESDRVIASLSAAEIITPQTRSNYQLRMVKNLLFSGGLRTFFRDLGLKRKKNKTMVYVNAESVEQFAGELSPWTLLALQSIMEGKEVVINNPIDELYACVEILDFTQKCIFTTFNGLENTPRLLTSRIDASRDLIIPGSIEKPIRTHPATKGGVLLCNDLGSRVAMEIGVAINAGTSGTSCNIVIALNNLTTYLKNEQYFYQHFSEDGLVELCHSYLAGPYLINILSDRGSRYTNLAMKNSELILPPGIKEKLHSARSGQSHTLVEVKNGISGAYEIISRNNAIPSDDLLEMLFRINARKTKEDYDRQ